MKLGCALLRRSGSYSRVHYGGAKV
jgi:hypothetical protein